MDGMGSRRVVVVGAGIVGACAAIELLRDGHRVTLLDPGEPGGEQAASYGNGCWLSPASVIPPATPGAWRRVPGWLSDPLGPLTVRWRHLPRALPWLARYLWSGRDWAAVERTAQALAPLLADSARLHAALAAEAGTARLIERGGLLYAYTDQAAFAREAAAWRIRRAVGIDWIELSAEELRQREPWLDRRYGFGVLVEAGGHCRDPGAHVAGLVGLIRAMGGQVVRQAATGWRIDGGRLRAVRTGAGEIAAEAAVLAAGARAGALAQAAGNRVPLATQRGYHAQVRAAEVVPRASVMLGDAAASVTRTDGGLRIAGQMEIAGLEAAPDWRRAQVLLAHLRRAAPGLAGGIAPTDVQVWMGHRPSLPDGLPCLGPARGTADIVHAFGHGHVGLAAGPRTGRLVAQLVAGRSPEIDVRPFAPARFR